MTHLCQLEESFPGSEGDWNHQVDFLVHSLEVATWMHELSRHSVDCSNAQLG